MAAISLRLDLAIEVNRHFLENEYGYLSYFSVVSNLGINFFRDWSRSIGGEGWVGAFRNVVVRKHMTHPFQLEQNGVTHP